MPYTKDEFIALRKDIIKKDFGRMNDMQLSAVVTAKGPLLVLAGAGSGKTESLKELLLYIKQSQPQARVACITHTNAAVAEIVSRVGDRYPISTIHSFLYGLIGDYKKNIKAVISELFFVPQSMPGCSPAGR